MKSTVMAAGWTGPARRRAWNVKLAWDRTGLRANRLHWEISNRKKIEGVLSYLAGEKKVWCRACSDQEVEDARHLLSRCGCEAYRVMRLRWHEKVMNGARE